MRMVTKIIQNSGTSAAICAKLGTHMTHTSEIRNLSIIRDPEANI